MLSTSVALVSQGVYAGSMNTKQCLQLQKHMTKSAHAKKVYNQNCITKRALPRFLTTQAKTKEQLKKERIKKKQRSITAKKGQYATKTFAKTGRFYVGASLGQSTLKPRVTVSGAGLDDKSDSAYKVFMGYKVKPRIAVEGIYADLGSAGIHTPSVANGKVAYKLFGLSGVYSQPFGQRVKGVAKLGYAKVDTSVSEGISFEQLNSGVLFFGAGLEYQVARKLSVRAEYEHFDKDIQLLSLGGKWSF